MSKIPLIFSGLGVGTAVTGGTHFVNNVSGNSNQVVKREQVTESSEGSPTTRADTEAKKQSVVVEPESKSLERKQSQEVDLSHESEEKQDLTSISSDVSGSAASVPAVDSEGSHRAVNDIIASSPTPKTTYKKGQLGQGSRTHPEIICVAEETGENFYDGVYQLAKRYSPACINKKDVVDYEKARTSEFCTLAINGNLSSVLSDRLRYRDNNRCRYWDSFVGPKTELSIEVDQIPEDFRGNSR
ncbi:hypothetical protein MHLP_01775 [Candidatus Mycoplasma haematolamae str. Purdue]|uniref:Uncharacterized protein n=1 Tax=Mycoplasma haematolamae (strain Purdue) TaxID=1212765 RepID=I7B9K9_MYCHA|nr:hypothetical protein [Candidatus Mycoplasma haematolamae]AFO51935.1 hypothetical protein MHLP_01775 [Candidatus Mycoplasma haematolamae str. Purdue]